MSTRKVLRNPVVVGRRHDEVPVGEDLGRVGIVARRSVEHHLFVGDADDRYAAARSRGQYVTAVVDGFDLAREPHERRSVGHVCGACGPPLPKGLSGIGVDDENASLCLFGQQQRVLAFVDFVGVVGGRFGFLLDRRHGNLRDLDVFLAGGQGEEAACA